MSFNEIWKKPKEAIQQRQTRRDLYRQMSREHKQPEGQTLVPDAQTRQSNESPTPSSDVWVERFVRSLRTGKVNRQIDHQRAHKTEALTNFFTTYKKLEVMYNRLYPALKGYYDAQRELAKPTSDIPMTKLQKMYQDTQALINHLEHLDADHSFQQEWHQMAQVKEEIKEMKDEIEPLVRRDAHGHIESVVGLGSNGQRAIEDIKSIDERYKTMKLRMLPVLSDSANPDLETLKKNLNTVLEKIYNLAREKAQDELQSANDFIERGTLKEELANISFLEYDEHGLPFKEKIAQIFEKRELEEACQKLSDVLKNPQVPGVPGKGKDKLTPEIEAQQKLEAFNQLAERFALFSKQFHDTKLYYDTNTVLGVEEKEESFSDSQSSVSMGSSIDHVDELTNPQEKDIVEHASKYSYLDKQPIYEIPKKSDKYVIEQFKPDPLMFRDCRVASVRDFKALADDLHRALKPGKSPERIYRVLYFLLREDEAIQKLGDAFEEKDPAGRSLETAVTQRFGRDEAGKPTPQLEYALYLLGRKDTSIDQTFNRRCVSAEESRTRVACLHTALLKRDSETVYAALTAYQRNTESLCRLNGWYKRYKQELKLDSSADITGLQADMKQYLEGDALKFSLFLIGDETMETKVVSLSEAERLSKMALQQTFERNDGVRVPVPYEAARSNGSQCLYRAHILAESLTELGYRVEKLFIQFLRTDEHGLKHAGFVNPDSSWWWHTACCMPVRTDSGTELRILDPSGASARDLDQPTLWTIDKWLEQHGNPDSYRFISFEEWEKLVTKERKKNPKALAHTLGSYPADQPYVFTANRNYLGIPILDQIKSVSESKDIPNQFSNTNYRWEGLTRITQSTKWVPYCRIAQDIRREMQELTINDDKSAQVFLNAIAEKFAASRSEFHLSGPSTGFSNFFPHSYKRFITHLRERVSPATIANFEKCLSGYKEQVEHENK